MPGDGSEFMEVEIGISRPEGIVSPADATDSLVQGIVLLVTFELNTESLAPVFLDDTEELAV